MTSADPSSAVDLSNGPSLWRIFRRNRMSLLGLTILVTLLALAILGPFISPYPPQSTTAGPAMTEPGLLYFMGTDELGRDIFSRVLVGTRVSLLVGISAAIIAALAGITVGSLAGFFGGWPDEILMRITEIFQVIPRFFLAVVLVAFFGANLINIVLAISLLSWPELARIVRSEFLTLRSRQFVDAARVAGAGTATLVFIEILPNAIAPVIVNATLQVGQAMLLEAGLAYLGLGDPSQISLGLMLFQAQQIMRDAWWATLFPGMFLALAVLSVNLIGDGLNDVLSPRSRER
jgi:peptide/nickel transport system permease protein